MCIYPVLSIQQRHLTFASLLPWGTRKDCIFQTKLFCHLGLSCKFLLRYMIDFSWWDSLLSLETCFCKSKNPESHFKMRWDRISDVAYKVCVIRTLACIFVKLLIFSEQEIMSKKDILIDSVFIDLKWSFLSPHVSAGKRLHWFL